MLHLRQPFGVIIGVLSYLRECGLPAGRVRMAHHGGLAREGIDGGGHVVTAQQVALHGLRQAALHVVAVHQADVTVTLLGLHPCAREVTRRVGLSRKGGQGGETGQGSEGIGVVIVRQLHFGRAQRQGTGIARAAHAVAAPAEGGRHHGLRRRYGIGLRTFALHAKPAERVIEVERIAPCGLLHARLREDHAVAPVAVVAGEVLSGTPGGRHAVAVVELVLIGMLLQVAAPLVLRREHEVQVVEIGKLS